MTNKMLDITIAEKVCTIFLNRPDVLNALSAEMINALDDTFTMLSNRDDVKVVILSGAGNKAFCAGGDLVAMAVKTPLQARETSLQAQALLRKIEDFPKPVIAAVNGYALGGGCELAMAADIRIAADQAQFGQPEIKLGIIPGFGGTQRLGRLLGLAHAKEICLTGRMIPAQEAQTIGLVNKVVPSDQLMPAALEMAKNMAVFGARALEFCKKALNDGLEMDKDKASLYEADLFALCFTTNDQKEGMQAFLEKRKATFNDC